MVIWNKRQPVKPPATPQPARPASRQRADDIRRKAQRCTDITEQTGDQNDDRRKATRQREQAEREMAALRAESVQARRFATQIKNLHQPATVQRKGRIMDTTIADPGQAQRMMRRTIDAPSPAGGQLNFNPLHPSMELPPEQLIRLLGLENKTKRRKKQRTPITARTGGENKSIKLSRPETPPSSAERERDSAPLPFEDSPPRILIPSLIAGAVAGIVISAYLFWNAPEEVIPSVTQTAPAQKIDRNTRPLPDTIGMVPATTPTAAPVKTTRQSSVKRANIIPQTEIEAEGKRLRSEAEQRFTQRMKEHDMRREQAALKVEHSAAIKPAVDVSIAAPTGLLDAGTDTAEDNLSTVTSIEGGVSPASPEAAIHESRATLPDNEITPVEFETELYTTTETMRVIELADSTPTEPVEAVEAVEADIVQDSVAEEIISQGLF